MKKLICVALLSVACASRQDPDHAIPPAATTSEQPKHISATTLHYTVAMMERSTGAQTATITDGARNYHFHYNDRGRGPDLSTRMRIGDGAIVELTTTGVDYYKTPIEERFTWDNGVARWQNRAEKGEKQVPPGSAFYLGMYSPPSEVALLVRALLRAEGKPLSLLPDGSATVRKVQEVQVTGPDGPITATQYAIIGLDFAPFSVWLDGDLELFASVSPWLSVIRRGYLTSIGALLAPQEKSEEEFYRSLGSQLGKKTAGGIVIKNVRVFDSLKKAVLSDRTVVISGNKIQAVGGKEVKIPAGAEVIDGAGKMLIPGLWDMHTHIGAVGGLLNIAAGVTSARDLANDTEKVLDLQRRFGDGSMVGPRLVLAGFIDGSGKYTGPTKMIVDNESHAKRVIDKYAELGFEQIKIYSSIKPELVAVIAKLAHAKGLRVSGHIPAHMTAEQAVKAGFDEIQHMNMLFLNFMPDVKETQTMLRLTAPGDRGGQLDLDSREVKSFIALLKQKRIVIDPTINLYEGGFLGRAGTLKPGYEAVASRLPPQVRRSLFTGGLDPTGEKETAWRASYERFLQFLKRLHQAGVPLVAGTDGLAGFTLHRELELYAQAGIPAADVLAIATIEAARVAKRDQQLGSITAGKLADVVLISGDATKNISAIRTVELTIKDGVIYNSRDVYAAIGVSSPAASQ